MSQNIVFVGAGGAGVSSLVLLFHELKLPNIIAIDSNESELTKKLQDAGVSVIIGHGIYTVQQHDIIIFSDAAEKSPEVQSAKEKVLQKRKRVFPPMSYFQFLGELSKYMRTISVAGTHGKSTTTALTATALQKHNTLFGLGIVGAPVNQWGHCNYLIGEDRQKDIKHIIEHILFPKGPDISSLMKKYFFVIEADEYNHHFLHLDSDYALITNIELDHADVYGDFATYLETFIMFGKKVKNTILVTDESLGIQAYKKHDPTLPIISATLETFEFSTLLGAHNHENASLALGCINHLSTDTPSLSETKETISNFEGLRRRGEFLQYNKHNVPIISDYGHHPSELETTLHALQEKYPGAPITCIFQPHQARRVLEFWDTFTTTLQICNTLIVYDIYAARENIKSLLEQSGTVFSDISSLDELGHYFAKTSGGIYTTMFSDITSVLDSTTQGIIVIFTAGNLDWNVRKYLTEKSF